MRYVLVRGMHYTDLADHEPSMDTVFWENGKPSPRFLKEAGTFDRDEDIQVGNIIKNQVESFKVVQKILVLGADGSTVTETLLRVDPSVSNNPFFTGFRNTGRW